ncbi:MAG TPA: GFA family protein [Burkholderiales bacterium]|nr:GFA family protein [Burkholderiales bacterium]
MHIDGGCHCGHITYEAEVDPDKVGICHCTDCQILTGSAFRVTVPSLKGTFKLLGGQPKVYVKTAESGAKRMHGFCPECGTPLYATSAEQAPLVYGIRVGTVRQKAALRPAKQGWCQSALDWSMNIESLPQSPMQTPR